MEDRDKKMLAKKAREVAKQFRDLYVAAPPAIEQTYYIVAQSWERFAETLERETHGT